MKTCLFLFIFSIVCLLGCKSPEVHIQQLSELNPRLLITPEGVNICYYPDGKLAYKGEFKDGQPVGTHEYYYLSGMLEKKTIFYKDGSHRESFYSENGRHLFEQVVYPDTKYRFGFTNNYFSDILILEKPCKTMEPYTGESRCYNETGFLIKKIKVVNGKSKVIYERNPEK
ncbi:hypothetical protein AAEX28_12215 [Lentisphaerota bacterium WC36G]|nr:hypothetical protein LJT99_15045 [Lentisphaerae bacterium WC36]